jgi:sec-independent protein translocase protein TatA
MFSGPWQIVLLLVVIVLVFGSKKLPELARALGKAKGEFKKGTQEGEQLLADDDKPQPRKLEQKSDDNA